MKYHPLYRSILICLSFFLCLQLHVDAQSTFKIDGTLEIGDEGEDTYRLPKKDGAAGHVLRTDGHGQTIWGPSYEGTSLTADAKAPANSHLAINAEPMAFYLDIPGIPGDAKDADHADQINAFGYDLKRVSSSASCNSYEFSVFKSYDRATPGILKANFDGEELSDVVLDQTKSFVSSGSVVMLIYEFEAVIINGIQHQRIVTPQGEYIPFEEISFRILGPFTITSILRDSQGVQFDSIVEQIECAN